jgi:hypothetical protein
MKDMALGRRASFWVSAGVVTHIFWTSAAPAMTYRLYAEQWHLTPTATTAIFAVYPIVVVAVLIGFGDLSDHIGRRFTMLLGLGASLIGTLLGSDATGKALVTMWERRAELDGFAPTMEGVRNSVPGLEGRAISGPHDYEQIPGLVERSKRRVVNSYADFDARLEDVPFVAGADFTARRTSPVLSSAIQ